MGRLLHDGARSMVVHEVLEGYMALCHAESSLEEMKWIQDPGGPWIAWSVSARRCFLAP